ncbi:uncharacterized protein LOC131849883 [Achroia grisella]|uniref:uncharacterized protein LOC131849883 n=1 Tax=Achroia grisella TaxID=688607 RepID=UPI0027D33487|nr:uncharacterized protein LOC131849883 [Achroia grisella]
MKCLFPMPLSRVTASEMNFLIILCIVVACFNFNWAYNGNSGLSAEQSFLDKLHAPWLRPDRPPPPDHPRKGEYICKGKICRTRPKDTCEGCQHAAPLDFKN